MDRVCCINITLLRYVMSLPVQECLRYVITCTGVLYQYYVVALRYVVTCTGVLYQHNVVALRYVVICRGVLYQHYVVALRYVVTCTGMLYQSQNQSLLRTEIYIEHKIFYHLKHDQN